MHLFQFCIFEKSVTFRVINYILIHKEKSLPSLEHKIPVTFEEDLFLTEIKAKISNFFSSCSNFVSDYIFLYSGSYINYLWSEI